jgi:hypothetical protein
MTLSTVAFSDKSSSLEAGNQLCETINKSFKGQKPNVVLLFAASTYDFPSLLAAIKKGCNPDIIVGSSSAGEFISGNFGTDAICAIALYSTEMKFSAGLGTGIKQDRVNVVEELSKSLTGTENYEYQYHSAMLLADALSGYTDELIDLLTEKTMGAYQFFGGGAGDNARFQKTHVFFQDQAVTDSAVILEILSNKPLGLGVDHGWKPKGVKMRVTASEGMKIMSLNGISPIELFEEYAKQTGQILIKEDPIPFFLHNIIGIETESGYKLRVPLAVTPEGSIICASDVPEGSIISFMNIEVNAASNAALNATNQAIQQLNGNKPSVALFFDCVATRLRMGKDFGIELNEVKNALHGTQYAGCNTYGQVARVDGQFSGFHNCTAVVCVIPE